MTVIVIMIVVMFMSLKTLFKTAMMMMMLWIMCQVLLLLTPTPFADAVADTDAAWILKYTLDPAGTVDDTRKKRAVWEFYGHLCPLTHPKLEHEKVCLKCYANNKNKAISMGGKNGKNPTSNKLVQHLRQMHVKDGVYAAYRKAVNALSNTNLATEKQSQTQMTSFAADNNAIKRDYKKLCAKWIIATHQPLYACDSK
jgi:hypothetical protein